MRNGENLKEDLEILRADGYGWAADMILDATPGALKQSALDFVLGFARSADFDADPKARFRLKSLWTAWCCRWYNDPEPEETMPQLRQLFQEACANPDAPWRDFGTFSDWMMEWA